MSDADDSIHEWDAAYVLGALSPDDRRRFEEHLDSCPDCRAAVADLAAMPALLAKVPAPTEAPPGRLAPSQHGELPATLIPTLARRVRRRRIIRRVVISGASVLAAAAIAAAVVVPIELNASTGTQIALEQTTPSPVMATVTVAAQRWGTELNLSCTYMPSKYTSASRDYALYVTDATGQATRVASWSAWPDSTIHTSAAVATPKSQLRTVQIRDIATGKILLSSPVK